MLKKYLLGTETTFVCLCTENNTYETASDKYMRPVVEEFDSEKLLQ